MSHHNTIKEEIAAWRASSIALEKRLSAESKRIADEIAKEKEQLLSQIEWVYSIQASKFRVDHKFSNREEDKEYADGFIIYATCDEKYKSLLHEGRNQHNGAFFMIINNVLIPTDIAPGSMRYYDLTPKAQALTDKQVSDIQAGIIPEGLIEIKSVRK